MMGEFKRRSVKKALVRFIVFAVIAAALIALGGYRVLSLVKGPTPITVDSDLDALVGEYVSLDLEYILDAYSYTENLRENQQEGTGELVSIEYMVALFDGRLLGLWIRESDLDGVIGDYNAYVDQYYLDAPPAEEDLLPAPRVEGVLQPMNDLSHTYFNETLDYYEISHDFAEYYMLKTNYLGNSDIITTIVVAALAGVALLFGLGILLFALTGGGQRELNRFIDDPGSIVDHRELDEWYESAVNIGSLWLGGKFIVYQKGMRQHIRAADDIVWAYQRTVRTNGVPSHSLMLGTIEGKLIGIDMRGASIGEALGYIETNYPNVALGYLPDPVAAFPKDPASLRDIAAEQRATPKEDPDDNIYTQ